MNPLLVMLIAQALDIAVGAIMKNPNEPSLAPLLGTLNAALSQAVGETAAQTTQRRADAEAIFAKHSGPAPLPPV